MNASLVINEVRSRLGDVTKTGWADTRMVSAVSAAQTDLCKFTGLYRKETYVELANNVTRYPLPADCTEISRIELNGEPIKVFTRSQLTKPNGRSSSFSVIKDELNMGTFDVVPIPSGIDSASQFVEGFYSTDTLFTLDSVFGVVVGGDLVTVPVTGELGTIELSPGTAHYPYGEICGLNDAPTVVTTTSELGIAVDIAYSLSVADKSLYGFVVSASPYTVSGKYGLITNVVLPKDALRIFYKATPPRVVNVDQLLVMPDTWFETLVQYSMGTLLQDDNDASNRQRGIDMLAAYQRELKEAKNLSVRDFNSSVESYETSYRRL